jgi:hypothetical protein
MADLLEEPLNALGNLISKDKYLELDLKMLGLVKSRVKNWC